MTTVLPLSASVMKACLLYTSVLLDGVCFKVSLILYFTSQQSLWGSYILYDLLHCLVQIFSTFAYIHSVALPMPHIHKKTIFKILG